MIGMRKGCGASGASATPLDRLRGRLRKKWRPDVLLQMIGAAVPTEQEMRDNPMKVFLVQNTNIWFESSGDSGIFYAAPADTGDCGDSFETYEEMVSTIE